MTARKVLQYSSPLLLEKLSCARWLGVCCMALNLEDDFVGRNPKSVQVVAKARRGLYLHMLSQQPATATALGQTKRVGFFSRSKRRYFNEILFVCTLNSFYLHMGQSRPLCRSFHSITSTVSISTI